MTRKHLAGAALTAAFFVAGGAAPAPAAVPFSSCKLLPGGRCAKVTVPLDRSGRVPGTVSLQVVKQSARRRTRAALVYLSGGPGGAGVGEFTAALSDKAIRDLRRRYDLATFDQRGTGRSGVLRCSAMERDARLRTTSAAASCAQQLGARRAFYTTRDSVLDLEAVRVALGAQRLFLYGVSYGTKLALAYARAYPQRVERLLLDSVVDPDDDDVFGIEPYRNLGDTLRGLCPRRCAGVTSDPVADLAALTAELRARPLRGLDPLAVSDLLFDADYAPELRAGIPAAVASVLRWRNPAPLRRLIRAARPLADPGSPRAFSSARYATTCEETPLPWDASTPVEERLAEARRRAAALGEGAFRPFDFEVLRADEIDLCLAWPTAPAAAPRPALLQFPAVPALVLQGGEDLRTPPSASSRVAGRMPAAQRVVVPGVGHAVLSSDISGCAQRRLRAWLRGARVPRTCPRVATGVPPAPVIPRRLADAQPPTGIGGQLGRTVSGISITLEDLSFELSPAMAISPTSRGLAGGRFSITSRGLRLRRYSTVPGLWLDGTARSDGVLRVRVGGSAAAAGRVTVSPGGRLAGRLGGRRVRATLLVGLRPRAAASAWRRMAAARVR